MKLTVRENDVLKYVIQFKQVNGYSPTVREISIGINSKSIPHICSMLESLRDKGYITYKEHSPRTIRVIKFI